MMTPPTDVRAASSAGGDAPLGRRGLVRCCDPASPLPDDVVREAVPHGRPGGLTRGRALGLWGLKSIGCRLSTAVHFSVPFVPT